MTGVGCPQNGSCRAQTRQKMAQLAPKWLKMGSDDPNSSNYLEKVDTGVGASGLTSFNPLELFGCPLNRSWRSQNRSKMAQYPVLRVSMHHNCSNCVEKIRTDLRAAILTCLYPIRKFSRLPIIISVRLPTNACHSLEYLIW